MSFFAKKPRRVHARSPQPFSTVKNAEGHSADIRKTGNPTYGFIIGRIFITGFGFRKAPLCKGSRTGYHLKCNT
jgi:hypothetical protein